ncbi:hypothetical protein GALMADRAFT_160347 [Galerina marginata CBS 339.88]|uniref:Uncharacterized protein n=1 Tax=Galerina marginata (strain CBS 339.88) TaxID=685588 RepID=A0A067SQC4_GALM3|nr:hypothetical protein GALMADRAFT_160347 [Galerina marginata CBS 339.88]
MSGIQPHPTHLSYLPGTGVVKTNPSADPMPRRSPFTPQSLSWPPLSHPEPWTPPSYHPFHCPRRRAASVEFSRPGIPLATLTALLPRYNSTREARLLTPARPPLQRVRDTHTKPTRAADTRPTMAKAIAGRGR